MTARGCAGRLEAEASVIAALLAGLGQYTECAGKTADFLPKDPFAALVPVIARLWEYIHHRGVEYFGKSFAAIRARPPPRDPGTRRS